MFIDLDEGEKKLGGIRVEMMNEKELIEYVDFQYRQAFKLKLPFDPQRETSYFRRFKQNYGGDAGLVIKWIFYKYQGVNESGTKWNNVWITSGFKTWIDQKLEEAREQKSRETKRSSRSRTTLTAKDLLGG